MATSIHYHFFFLHFVSLVPKVVWESVCMLASTLSHCEVSYGVLDNESCHVVYVVVPIVKFHVTMVTGQSHFCHLPRTLLLVMLGCFISVPGQAVTCFWREECTAVSLPSWLSTAGRKYKGHWTLTSPFLALTPSKTCKQTH